jgi:hypothetical protein
MGRRVRKNTTMQQRVGEKLTPVNTLPVKNSNPVFGQTCQPCDF